jgi:hypothetical protein
MNFLSPMSGLLENATGGGGRSQGLNNFMSSGGGGIASMYNTGSQKLSAPALSTLLGSMYQPQQGTPYAPGPGYYDELLDIMRQQAAGASSGLEGYESLLAALMGPQQTQTPQIPQTPQFDFGAPTLNEFMRGGISNPVPVGSAGYIPNTPGASNSFAFV